MSSSAHAATPVSDEIKHTIGRALGRVPSGIFILTATHGADSAAILASWVQQAAFNPPAVSVAISRDRRAAQLVQQSKRFALSVLGEHDSALMKKYARGVPPAESFTNVNTRPSPAGVPFLADALAYLECRLLTTATFNADHDLFVAEVTAGELLKEGSPFTHHRGNGFHY